VTTFLEISENFAVVRDSDRECHGKKSCQGKPLRCMHGMGSWHWLWHDWCQDTYSV